MHCCFLLERHHIFCMACGILLFLSSCKQQGTPTQIAYKQQNATKHFDIPVPVAFSQTFSNSSYYSNFEHELFRYQGSQQPSRLVDFYCHELERSGWDVHNFSVGSDVLLAGKKPNKDCCIVIELDKKSKKTNVSVFVTHKK